MNLRKFNREGMRRFEAFVSVYMTGGSSPSLEELQMSDALSLQVTDQDQNPLSEVSFDSRLGMARSMDLMLTNSNIGADLLNQPEFWAWLTAAFFERLKILKGNKPGAMALWLPERNWTRFYRHVLYGPWRVYRFHKSDTDLVEPLLAGKVTSHGEFFEQLAAYQDLVQSPGVLGAARALYWDDQSKTLRKGHARKGEPGEATGSIRRFSEVCQQLALTRDLMAISSAGLLELLPEEFDRWK